MTGPAPIEVRLTEGSGLGGRVRAVARALGAPLSVRGVPAGPSRVGDVALREDAEPWRVEAALLRALSPRHVLFLCVANSARSQLAEGIARSMAGDGVRISSAGSEPGTVRPQAVAVLAEIGIDASSQRSKAVDAVTGPVDAVITLCAEEVCPAWLGGARRLHWGLPDPAGAGGTEEERLAAFRLVRDELRTRLAVLLGPTSLE